MSSIKNLQTKLLKENANSRLHIWGRLQQIVSNEMDAMSVVGVVEAPVKEEKITRWLGHNTPKAVHHSGRGVITTLGTTDSGAMTLLVQWMPDWEEEETVNSVDWKKMWINPTEFPKATMYLPKENVMGTCKRNSCNEPKVGSQFCGEHSCSVEGCNNGPKKGEVLCGPHIDQAEKEYEQHPGMEIIQQEAQIANKEVPKTAFILVHGPQVKGEMLKWHSPLRNEQREKLVSRIEKAVEVFEEVTIISTGALGVAQDACAIAHEMGLKYELYLPCKDMGKFWRDEQAVAIFDRMVSKSSYFEYLHEEYSGGRVYTDALMGALDAANFMILVDGPFMERAEAMAKNKKVKVTRL